MHTRMIDLGKKIRRLRKHLGLKQGAFGELIGVTQSTIARWEGGSKIYSNEIIALADLAGQTVDDFLKSEDVLPTITEDQERERITDDLKVIASIDEDEYADLVELVRKRAAAARARSERGG